MATIEATYQGQTDGAVATVANSDDFGDTPIDAFVGTGTATYDTDHPAGMAGLTLTTSGGTGSYYYRYDLENGFTSCAVRFYIYLGSLPSTTVNFPTRIFSPAAANCVQILMLSDGRLRTQNTASTTIATSTGTLAATTLYRIEYQISGLNGSSGTVALQAFLGHGTTPITGINLSNSAVTTTATGRYVGLGKSSSATLSDYTIFGFKAVSGSNTAIGPAPQNEFKVGSDTMALTDVSALSQGRTGSDSITLTDTFGALLAQLARSDEAQLTEAVTETQSDYNTDDHTLTEGPAVMTAAVAGSDSAVQGDDLAGSITDVSGVSWGGSFTNDYIVMTQGQADQFTVGDDGLLFTSGNALKHETIFEVTSKSPPAFGFVNVFVSPTPPTAAANGDTFRRIVTVAGSQLAKSQGLTDSAALSEAAELTVALSSTDTAALTDSSSLDQGVTNEPKSGSETHTLTGEVASLAMQDFKTGSDTQTLSEGTPTLLQAYTGTDTATQSEGTTSLARTSTGTDSAALTESASVAAALSSSDSVTVTDTSSTANPVGSADTFTMSDAVTASTAAVAGSETHTTTDTAALAVHTFLAASETHTQTESPTGLARASEGVEVHTQTEGTTVHAAATVSTDTHTLTTEQSTLNAGGENTSSDTQTLSEAATITGTSSTTDASTQTEAPTLLARSSAVTDTSSLTDTAALTQAYVGADSATLADSSSLVIVTGLAGSDTFTTNDTSSLLQATARTGSDTQSMSESASLIVQVVGTDDATLTETSGATAALTASDFAILDDQSLVLRLFQLLGVDEAVLSESSLLVIDELSDDDFPRSHFQFPDLMPTSNITFPEEV